MGIKTTKMTLLLLITLFALIWVGNVAAQETDQVARQIAWSPDGTMLAVGISASHCNIEDNVSNPEALIILDSDTQQRLFTVPNIKCNVLAMAWSPDNTKLAFGASTLDGVRVWDVVTQEFDPNIAHSGDGSGLSWSPDGSVIIFGDGHGKLLIVNAMTGDITQRFPGAGTLNYSAWNSEGTKLALTIFPNDLVILDTEHFTGLARVILEKGFFADVDWSQNSNIISIYNHITFDIVDGDSYTSILSISSESIFSDTALSPNGNLIAGTSPLAGIYIWDTTTGELVTNFDQEGIFAIDWSPDGSRLAYVPSGNDDELVGFLDDFEEAAP